MNGADTMNEQQIELSAEHQMDALDRLLMNNTLTQEDYDRKVKELDEWTTRQIGWAAPL